MAEHLHIDYPLGGGVRCNELLGEIDWNKPLDTFDVLETLKARGLIVMMYDFPKLMATTHGRCWDGLRREE